MHTNSGNPIGNCNARGKYYPMDGRRETHPAWMAWNVKRLDPFQDAVPCWLETHKAHASPLANRWITNLEARSRSSWTEHETRTYNTLISE